MRVGSGGCGTAPAEHSAGPRAARSASAIRTTRMSKAGSSYSRLLLVHRTRSGDRPRHKSVYLTARRTPRRWRLRGTTRRRRRAVECAAPVGRGLRVWQAVRRRGGSSAGQSMGLIIPGSWVRAPPAPPVMTCGFPRSRRQRIPMTASLTGGSHQDATQLIPLADAVPRSAADAGRPAGDPASICRPWLRVHHRPPEFEVPRTHPAHRPSGVAHGLGLGKAAARAAPATRRRAVEFWSGRQHVTPERPTRLAGIWIQAMPVSSTKTRPASAARSYIGRGRVSGSGACSAAAPEERPAPTVHQGRVPFPSAA